MQGWPLPYHICCLGLKASASENLAASLSRGAFFKGSRDLVWIQHLKAWTYYGGHLWASFKRRTSTVITLLSIVWDCFRVCLIPLWIHRSRSTMPCTILHVGFWTLNWCTCLHIHFLYTWAFQPLASCRQEPLRLAAAFGSQSTSFNPRNCAAAVEWNSVALTGYQATQNTNTRRVSEKNHPKKQLQWNQHLKKIPEELWCWKMSFRVSFFWRIVNLGTSCWFQQVPRTPLRLLALMPSSREKLRQEVGIGGRKTVENPRNVLKPTAFWRCWNTVGICYRFAVCFFFSDILPGRFEGVRCGWETTCTGVEATDAEELQRYDWVYWESPLRILHIGVPHEIRSKLAVI